MVSGVLPAVLGMIARRPSAGNDTIRAPVATLGRSAEHPVSPPLPARRVGAALTLIVVLALGLRSYGLGDHCLWYDEGFSALMAEAGRLSVWLRDTQPPLYYALLSLWRLASDGDGWLRFLSVILGVATVPVVYALGAALFDRTAGLWSAGLLGVTWAHVQYSRETRMYSLLVLAFAGALWGLVLAVSRQRPIGWVVYATSGVALVYSHALGLLYAVVLAVAFPLLARDLDRWRTWRPWLLANGVIALSFLPWLPIFLERAGNVTSGFWIPPAGTEPPILTTLHSLTVDPIPSLFSILHERVGLPFGRRALGRWVWFAPILLAVLWIVARAPRQDRRATGMLVTVYVLPIAALTAVSLMMQPLLIPRVLLPTVVPVVLLLGAGVGILPGRRVLGHAGLALVATILLLATIYFLRQPPMEDWRALSRELAGAAHPTDLFVFDVDSWLLPSYLVARYDPTGRLARIPQLSLHEIAGRCKGEVGACLNRAVAPYPAGQRVWVVHSHSDTVREHEKVAAWLDERLEGRERHQFTGILLEGATLRSPP
jgi:4-amino-4-deoxy-L-arabinose transferase-like glycosyltransferase